MISIKNVLSYIWPWGKQMISEVDSNLFTTGWIHNWEDVQDLGISVIVDLEGKFDTDKLSGFVKYYYWFTGFKDKPELPSMEDIMVAGMYSRYHLSRGRKVLVH